jgi:hypothetical protein
LTDPGEQGHGLLGCAAGERVGTGKLDGQGFAGLEGKARHAVAFVEVREAVDEGVAVVAVEIRKAERLLQTACRLAQS